MCIISKAVETTADDSDAQATDAFISNVDVGDVEYQDDDDDADNENAISVEKLKREVMGSPYSELQNLAAGK